jgi:hypothetical protein
LGVIVGVATVGKLTVKLNVAVLETPPLSDAVTVMLELPAGVEPLVLMVRVEEQLGLQLFGEKEAVAPEGNPEAENVTGCVLPETNVALIELVTADPATIDLFPELESEKSNNLLTVNETLASGLGLYPLLNALALTTALLVRVMAPVYRVEDWLGILPSVV